jgi:hypothetical protein
LKRFFGKRSASTNREHGISGKVILGVKRHC